MNDNYDEVTTFYDQSQLENMRNNAPKNNMLVIVDNNGVSELDLNAYPNATYYFGRKENNNIVVNSSIVSGNHGEICINNGVFYIKDNGSTNGTYMAYGSQFYKLTPGQYYGGDGKDMIIRLGSPTSSAGRDTALMLYNANGTSGRWFEYVLHSGDNSIGRAESCDIRIKNVAVSRLHAGVRFYNDGFYVFDNKSTNGVFVNGVKISRPVKLEDKDIFTILNTTFIFSGNRLFYKVNPEGIALNVKGLNKVVSAKGGKKTILDKVDLNIGANEFVAIIGGSGAGKTTLMTAMSGFDSHVTGDVYCNGINLRENFQTLKNLIGFVPQQDIIYENITLKKMLYYTAKLKMPEDTSKAEINERIQAVLEMVELKEHQDTYIRRLSGGQKKRASIAVELLANPGLFFLDEPTSGLDPGTEQHLMKTLNRLSKEQEKTIIMVTHTTNNLNLCDKVIIMGYGGKLCYCGSPDGIEDFFQTKDIVEVYDKITADTNNWQARFKMSGINRVDDVPVDSQKEIKPKKFSNLNQLSVLIRRYLTLIRNDLERLAMIFIQPVLIGLLMVLVAKEGVYDKMHDTQSIMFALTSAGIWMGLFNTIQEICKERVILKREYMANLKLPIYMLSKYIVQAVIALLQAIIIIGVFVACKGAPKCDGVIISNPTIELMVSMFVTIFVSAAFGLLISSFSKNADRAMTVAPFVLIIQLIFSGILFELNGATENISYFTFSRWSMESLGTTNDLNDLEPIDAEAKQEAEEEAEKAKDEAEEKQQELIDDCNESIADMQSGYADTINELQDQVESLSAALGQPQTFEEFVPETVDVTPEEEEETEEEDDDDEEEPNKMYLRNKPHMLKCWGILLGETFLFAGASILVLRKLKDEQR